MPTYDPPSGAYTSRIPSGTAALRKAVADLFSIARTEVIRDKSRCNQTRSEHCECRAIDFFTTDLILGRRIFNTLVACADDLGIQSVIFNRRVWGFGTWTERLYTGPSPHTDHVHAGIDIAASQTLTYDFAYMVIHDHLYAPTPAPPPDEEDSMPPVLVQKANDTEVYVLHPSYLEPLFSGRVGEVLYGDWGALKKVLPATDEVWQLPIVQPG